MTGQQVQELTVLTVGQVAESFGVTVRTLHHYDEIGLLSPSERSAAGYRLYTDEDLTRLQHVVVYRRLGFPLEQISELLDGGTGAAVVEHLHRQRAAVMSRLEEMRDLVTAIDRALEQEMTGNKLTDDEMRELFGDAFDDDYAEEAQQRWGDTDAWQQSQRRTARYTRSDWEDIKAEQDASNAAFVAAMEAGQPADSVAAMDAAEASRRTIERWFYDITPDFHRNLGDMYLQDPRFTKTYEDIRPGLAQFVRDAIHANADRADNASS
ncbi:MerR family transcriptional regulator [Ornithinimicrobium cryptoxanthini]|uniref:MerR family transcriptional regulator n=1 Tax=Ornithinimicrobium cryptoxanthini TaxID=2934161 RepID=A0ABY4YHT6_9MICO|nr:MerR family transcriptional regulator [Ornithinimicrobium cryptoxanthini]USQ76172.1 MerR family transcriptional regulator [Ornithinimicrobium cryptoxanthini]